MPGISQTEPCIKTENNFEMAVTLNVYVDIIKVLQKHFDFPVRVCVEGNSCFKQVNREQKHEPTHNSSSMFCPEDTAIKSSAIVKLLSP